MNIDKLDNVCKEVCRSKFEWYKYALANNPFGKVNKGIVDDSIAELNIEIGTSISKKFFKTFSSMTDQQTKVFTKTVDYYKNITLRKAESFGLKQIN